MNPDKTAVYEPRTETIRTGSGEHVRMRDLHKALSAVNPFNLRRILTISGIGQGVNDPMEAGQEESVRDIVDLIRGMPQYCLPVINAGLSLPKTKHLFEELSRDRAFGTSEARNSETAAAPVRTRRKDVRYNEKVLAFFWETRKEEGEFSYFIRHDRKTVTLKSNQRFSSTQPYEDSFLIMRTAHGRYYVRWPSEDPDEPAYYFDAQSNPIHFYPATEDFEELFPGYSYEVYGTQFALPNIGTDYRAWLEDFDYDEPSLGEDENEAPKNTSARHLASLLALLEAEDLDIRTAKELSKQFRNVSAKYHPLKHLQASPEEKEKINARYLEITQAYNELKKHYA